MPNTDPSRLKVEEAIRVATDGLGSWMGSHLGVWPPDHRGDVSPHDPSYLVEILVERRISTFSDALTKPGLLPAIYRFKEVRNDWAHLKPGVPTAQAAIEAAEALLRAIESPLAGSLSVTATRPRVEDKHGVVLGHRRSRSLAYRAEQWDARRAAHCRPINDLVDQLIVEGGGRWMPYVAPYHGGVNAELLLLFQDPGRMTNEAHGGSGFIGCENDDPSAHLLATCLDEAGIDQGKVAPWNSYPWFLPDQGNVTVARRTEGLDPLHRLIRLLPSLHTVVSFGKIAHDTWNRFGRAFPGTVQQLRHFETFHTSGQGIVNGGHQTKAVGVAHVTETLRAANIPPAGSLLA